jgi:hypothetical protein
MLSTLSTEQTDIERTAYLTEHQVARLLSCSVSKLRQDRMKSRGIAFSKFGRSVRYAMDDVQATMKAARIEPREIVYSMN